MLLASMRNGSGSAEFFVFSSPPVYRGVGGLIAITLAIFPPKAGSPGKP
jgi:hypothetical protein